MHRSILSCALVLLFVSAAGTQAFPVVPGTADTTSGNTTFTILDAIVFSKVFLLRQESGHNCSYPPSVYNALHVRTVPEVTRPHHYVRFDISKLMPGVYDVCVQSNVTGVFKHPASLPTVTITTTRKCSGGRFGICAIDPPYESSHNGNRTFTVYYATPGTKAFLIKPKENGADKYNCSKPPPMESNKRTTTETVRRGGRITFNLKGLEAGDYAVCFYNYTDATAAQGAAIGAGYVRLSVSIAISGEINPVKSVLSCCSGPFLVGEKTYCTINTVDTSGVPAGTQEDECRFGLCPLTDGRGGPMIDWSMPKFVKTGTFEFWVKGEGSGCAASVGASIDGKKIGNKVNYFSLQPAAVDKTKGTSFCSVSAGGTALCNVTQRDTYGNPVRKCAIDAAQKLHCENV